MSNAIEPKAADNTAHLETAVSRSEKPQDVMDDAHAQGQLLSGFEGMGAIATIRLFKKAFIFCFIATFAAACDGYQVRGSHLSRWRPSHAYKIDRSEWQYHRQPRLRCPIRHDHQFQWRPHPGGAGTHRHRNHPISRSDHCHDQHALVSGRRVFASHDKECSRLPSVLPQDSGGRWGCTCCGSTWSSAYCANLSPAIGQSG